MTTCMENLEMSGILTAVSEMSGLGALLLLSIALLDR